MRCPLSYHGIEVLKNSISEIVMTLNSPIKKVIAIDCDQTLWGGIIGEDGI